jgi:hypothetical protein
MNIEEKYLRKINKIKKLYINTTPIRKEESCIDEEELHRELDDLLIDMLMELGYTELVNKYEQLQSWFWYS